MLALALAFDGGVAGLGAELSRARPVLFLALLGRILLGAGGFIPAMRRQISRHRTGHPAFQYESTVGPGLGRAGVWRTGAEARRTQVVVAGSLLMIAGAIAIGYAEPAVAELASWQQAMWRECDRYGLDRGG